MDVPTEDSVFGVGPVVLDEEQVEEFPRCRPLEEMRRAPLPYRDSGVSGYSAVREVDVIWGLNPVVLYRRHACEAIAVRARCEFCGSHRQQAETPDAD